MALLRRATGQGASLFRQRSTAVARNSNIRQSLQQVRTRGYASGHGGAAKTSDIPWLLGSIAVTAPCLWYIGIWKPDPNSHHDEHGEHDEHSEGGESEEGEKQEGGSDDQSQSSESSGSEDNKDTPSSSDDEGEKDKGKKDKDEANITKPAGTQNTTSGKQEGMYNADTRHSTDVGNDPSKSTKAEGGPDTAKAKGTVQTDRELPEQANKNKEG